MSNHLISEAYKRQLGNMARNAVMVLLADKASDDGSGIWASKQRMAEEIGATKQTVIATIKSLTADGLITESGKRKSPNGYTIEYAINVKALKALPLVKSHAEDQSSNLTGQAISPVKEADLTSQPASPDQSSNLTQTPLNPPKPPKSKQTQTHAIPDDWEPAEFGLKTKSRGVVDGWPPGELAAQLEHFTAHHRGKGNRFTDWQDAWSTWVLNSRKYGNRNDGHRGPYRQPDRRDGAVKYLHERLGLGAAAEPPGAPGRSDTGEPWGPLGLPAPAARAVR